MTGVRVTLELFDVVSRCHRLHRVPKGRAWVGPVEVGRARGAVTDHVFGSDIRLLRFRSLLRDGPRVSQYYTFSIMNSSTRSIDF